jgi:hypothetical protein
MHKKLQFINLMERENMEDTGIYVMTILKCILADWIVKVSFTLWSARRASSAGLL